MAYATSSPSRLSVRRSGEEKETIASIGSVLVQLAQWGIPRGTQITVPGVK
jgi:hypothetical protein